MGSRRCVMLLDLRYAAEREVYEMIKAAPAREGAAFTRALMVMGHKEIKREKSQAAAAEKGALDET